MVEMTHVLDETSVRESARENRIVPAEEALPAGWEWTRDPLGGSLRWLELRDADGAEIGTAWPDGEWCRRDHDDLFVAKPPTLLAAQRALVASLRATGVMPAAAALDTQAIREAWDSAAEGGCTTRECVIAAILDYDRQRFGGTGGE